MIVTVIVKMVVMRTCHVVRKHLNPFSAMGDFKYHIIVNCTYFGVKELIEALISGVNCSSERFTVAKNVL